MSQCVCSTSLEAYQRPQNLLQMTKTVFSHSKASPRTGSQICVAILTGDAQQLKVTHLSRLDANSINQLQQVCLLVAAAVSRDAWLLYGGPVHGICHAISSSFVQFSERGRVFKLESALCCREASTTIIPPMIRSRQTDLTYQHTG
jgi:hypothetical protein